jgi:hypothetical protein
MPLSKIIAISQPAPLSMAVLRFYQDGDTVYEGRLVNREQGQYKGYPLGEDEWPIGWRK